MEEEWQEVPAEWLATEATDNSAISGQASGSSRLKNYTRTGLESDGGSVSDLTELSDEESESSVRVLDEPSSEGRSGSAGPSKDQGDISDDSSADEDVTPKVTDARASEGVSTIPDDFVEWETVGQAQGDHTCY